MEELVLINVTAFVVDCDNVVVSTTEIATEMYERRQHFAAIHVVHMRLLPNIKFSRNDKIHASQMIQAQSNRPQYPFSRLASG